MSTLSKLFTVLIELRLVDSNPVRLVKKLSVKSGERQVYISHQDFRRIVEQCPEWFRAIAETAYYTGMRRGEILGLTRKRVKLSQRMILLGPDDTKEGHWKRVPIHRELVPVLESCLRVASLDQEQIFLIKDRKGVRVPSLEGVKNPWPRACESLELEKPWPRIS